MMMRLLRTQFTFATMAACLVAFPSIVEAGFIVDRATLNSILGSNATNELFETFNISSGTSIQLGSTTLNSSTVTLGQGPGLVVGGINVIDSGGLQWNGNNYLGLVTKSVSGVAPGSSTTIDFTQPTTAFGVNVETYQSFPITISATVFATDNTTILGTMSSISLPGPSAVFVGFTNASGVGGVQLTTTSGQTFSPVIDNLTFGAATVAEPASLVMMSLGLAAVAALAWHRRLAA
jgi:hypothetical protein